MEITFTHTTADGHKLHVKAQGNPFDAQEEQRIQWLSIKFGRKEVAPLLQDMMQRGWCYDMERIEEKAYSLLNK